MPFLLLCAFLDISRNCLMNLKNSGVSTQRGDSEHYTGIAEVMGSNPVESPEFFRFMRQLLKIVQQVRESYLLLINE